MDLWFAGPSFTWARRRDARICIHSRLNEAFCNVEWRSLFPEGVVGNLPKIQFDHCPIMIRPNGGFCAFYFFSAFLVPCGMVHS